MAEKLKVLDYAGLDFMLQQIKKDFVTRDEFEMLKARVYKVESMLNDEKK